VSEPVKLYQDVRQIELTSMLAVPAPAEPLPKLFKGQNNPVKSALRLAIEESKFVIEEQDLN